MDISDTLAPNSDQLDAVDLLGGARVFTISEVSKGNAEQPVQIHLAEFPRPWRPGKSMRRVLVACWGPDAAQYVGRRVELYCDPDVKFGGATVGGTRVKRLSHIDGVKKVPLLVTRGKSAMFTVEPLPDVVPGPTEADVNASTDTDLLRSWWGAYPHLRDVIKARVDALKADAADGGDLPLDPA
jgi:hypothetical protein